MAPRSSEVVRISGNVLSMGRTRSQDSIHQYQSQAPGQFVLGLIYDLLLRPLFTSLITTTTSSLRTTLFAMVALSTLLPTASAFNFTTPLAQCANITMVWSGGQAPYEVLLIPVGHLTPEIRTIINYQNIESTTFSFPLTFPAGSQFIAVLSDSESGPGSGGTSEILTVDSSNDTSCLATQQVKPEFYFYLQPTTPSQCEPWQIAWPLTALTPPSSSNASSPSSNPNPPQQDISIWAVVPGGPSFAVPLPISSDPDDPSLDCSNWEVDLKANTEVILVAGYEPRSSGGIQNGRGKGGSTDLMKVGGSSDTSCLSDDPPPTSTFPPNAGTGSTSTVLTSYPGGPTQTAPTTTSTRTPVKSSGSGASRRRSPVSSYALSLLALGAGAAFALS